MKHTKTWMATSLLAALVSATGCSGFKQFVEIIAPPSAKVESVELIETTDEGSRLAVTVSLVNGNDVPLSLRDANYSVTVADGESYRFSSPANRTVPANGAQVVVLPVAVPHVVSGGSYRVSGSVIYEPPGEIRKLMTESHIPLPWVAFRSSGELGG